MNLKFVQRLRINVTNFRFGSPANRDLYRDQVTFLAQQTPITLLVSGGVTLFTSLFLWNVLPGPQLLVWITAQCIFIIAIYLQWRREGLRQRLKPALPAREQTAPKKRRMIPQPIIWGGLGGGLWGVLLLLFPELNDESRLAVIIVLLGMASGASSVMAAIPTLAASFILTSLTPLTLYFFLQGTPVYTALGAMALIYILSLLYSAHNIYGRFLEFTQNRRENAALLEQIREERAAAAETLARSEERYSDVVENVGDLVVSTNGDGGFLFVNQAFREKLGYSGEDLQRLTFRGILHEDHLRQSLDRIGGILRHQAFDPVELALKTKDGDIFWSEGKISPLIENGRLTRIHGVFRDIGLRRLAEQAQRQMQEELQLRVTAATSDLAEKNISLQREVAERLQAERAWRNSEAQLRLILDSSVEAIYGVDREGRCTFANSACAHLLGFQEASDLLGADMHTLTHAPGGGISAEACAICQVNRENIRTHADDQKFTRRDGSTFAVEYSAGSIIRDSRIVGGVVAFLDITRRLTAEEKLRQSQKMEAIGQLTGGIAHDFNNLLAIILGNLDLLASSLQKETPPQADVMARRARAAIHASERASALTQRLLTFSQKKMLSPQIIDPAKIMADMSDMLRRTLGGEIQLEIRVDETAGKVLGDDSLLENAIINLSLNARDAMPDGGVLSIGIGNTSLDETRDYSGTEIPAGDYLRIRVRDTGTGIAQENLGRVFEPFFTTKEAGKGTGLGLSMVFDFVQQISGHLYIDSAPGCGTEVNLFLPLAAPPAAIHSSRQGPSDSGAGPTEIFNPAQYRILVAEDDPGVRQTTEAQLREMGYDVVAAEDGPAALRLFSADPGIDLLYSDISMPNGMNGYTLAEKIRAIRADIRILLCTGYAGDTGSASTGAHNFKILQKPVRKDTLAAALQEALNC